MGRVFCFPVFSRRGKAKFPLPKASDGGNAPAPGPKDNHFEVLEDASSSHDHRPKDNHFEVLEDASSSHDHGPRDMHSEVVEDASSVEQGPRDAHYEAPEESSSVHQTKLNNGEANSRNSLEEEDNTLACCAVLKEAEHLSDPGICVPDASCASSEANPASQESDAPSEFQEGCAQFTHGQKNFEQPPSSVQQEAVQSCSQISTEEDDCMRRVGEWVKSIEITEEPFEEQLLPVEKSKASLHSVQRKDLELASNVARALDIHSTAAHLNNIGLTLIPSLGAFSQLRVLKLSGNSITKISAGCLPKSLHFLDLSRNKIPVIEGLRELTRLRTLNLSYNRIARIGQGLSNCTAIRELHLAGNKLSEVEGLHRLTKLTCVDISFNRLASLKSLEQLAANYASLASLDLVGNPVVANVGEEHLKRFVRGLAPGLANLNRRQLTKGARVGSSSQWGCSTRSA